MQFKGMHWTLHLTNLSLASLIQEINDENATLLRNSEIILQTNIATRPPFQRLKLILNIP